MSIHNKQFLVGNQPKKIDINWETVKIGGDLYLSHCPNISVGKIKDLNGVEWHLLGIAIQTNKEKEDPLTEIANSLTENVKELYKSWTGRWVLVGDHAIHTDCSGILGCFYTTKNEEKWISSSLAILQEIGRFSPRPENLKWKSFFEWYPLPMTRFEEVHKLLPSQIFDLRTFSPVLRGLPQPIIGLSYDEILDKIIEKFTHALLIVSNLNKKIFLPLTAGYDSRLILAAAYHAGIKVETYSQESKYISSSDVKFPYKLAKKAGYSHRYIKMKKSNFSKEKQDLYDYHTGRDVDDVDRKKYAYGQWDFLGNDDLILRGGIFEVARGLYYSKMDSDLNIETIIKRYGIVDQPDSFYYKAWSEWIKWVNQTPIEGVDWRDRFYLEQRVAGWMSAIEQSLDLTNTERFYLVNCHDIISLLLSVPVEKRKISEHHVDLINKMLPSLLQYPFNPPDPALKRLRQKVIKISKMPLTEVYKKLRKRVFN